MSVLLDLIANKNDRTNKIILEGILRFHMYTSTNKEKETLCKELNDFKVNTDEDEVN